MTLEEKAAISGKLTSLAEDESLKCCLTGVGLTLPNENIGQYINGFARTISYHRSNDETVPGLLKSFSQGYAKNGQPSGFTMQIFDGIPAETDVMMAYLGFVESFKPISESIGAVFKNSQVPESTDRYLYMDILGKFTSSTDPEISIYTTTETINLDSTFKFYNCMNLSLKIKNPDSAAIVHTFTQAESIEGITSGTPHSIIE